MEWRVPLEIKMALWTYRFHGGYEAMSHSTTRIKKEMALIPFELSISRLVLIPRLPIKPPSSKPTRRSDLAELYGPLLLVHRRYASLLARLPVLFDPSWLDDK